MCHRIQSKQCKTFLEVSKIIGVFPPEMDGEFKMYCQDKPEMLNDQF